MQCPICTQEYEPREKFFESKRLQGALSRKSNLCICLTCLKYREEKQRACSPNSGNPSESKPTKLQRVLVDIPERPKIRHIPVKIGSKKLNLNEVMLFGEKNPGVIYVIGPLKGPYKIGYTKVNVHGVTFSVNRRMADIQTGSWEKLYVHHISEEIGDVRLIEDLVHGVFNEKRLIGEWFNCNLNLITEAIDKLCFVHNQVLLKNNIQDCFLT